MAYIGTHLESVAGIYWRLQTAAVRVFGVEQLPPQEAEPLSSRGDLGSECRNRTSTSPLLCTLPLPLHTA